jgi:hypothetical protein
MGPAYVDENNPQTSTTKPPAVGYHFRDALRLLFILVGGSEPAESGEEGDYVFHGEKRAMAIDFLVRYPDYLADALLDQYEETDDRTLLDAAQAIFDRDEPDVRLVRMVRWRRGAFQNMETALSILQARDLVRPMIRHFSADQKRYEFIVRTAARRFLDTAVAAEPPLKWYEERVALVLRIAGIRSGSSLKDDQYEHKEYREAPLGSAIPSIKERVLARLHRLQEAK